MAIAATGIFIVTYNKPELLIRQVECIRKYCTDISYDIVVVDNSSDKQAAEAIHYHADRLGCQYMRTHSSSKGGSESHAFAANISYNRKGARYEQVLYLDHDNFPILPFSVAELLDGVVIAGLGQQKKKLYIWPGFVAISNKDIDTGQVDFSCSIHYGLDTGGMLFNIIEKYGIERARFVNESYAENPHFTTPPYNYYSLLYDGRFMHFVNGSNWAKADENEARINSLLNVLQELTTG
jgi:glycosyltransferase involved in cell wall biosynthesis